MALRTTKITATDPPSYWWPGESSQDRTKGYCGSLWETMGIKFPIADALSK